jgi:hypothetical protein
MGGGGQPRRTRLRSYNLGAGVIHNDTGLGPSNIVGKTVLIPQKLWDARLAGSTQCTVGGFIRLHAFGLSSPKPAYVIQKTDNSALLPGRDRFPHQHHRARGPARSSEEETDLF